MFISGEQLLIIKRTFDLFDQDWDGLIKAEDLAKAFEILGTSDSNSVDLARRAIAEVRMECGNKGPPCCLNFAQFLDVMAEPETVEELERDYREAFAAMDLDGDGKLTTQDVQRIYSHLGGGVTEEDAAKMIEADGEDGGMNADQFVKMMVSDWHGPQSLHIRH